MIKASHAATSGTRVSQATSDTGFNIDWITRPLFGVIMAGVALAAVFAGRWSFGILVAAAGTAALREWHRIIEKGVVPREFVVSA
ncbi:MAG: hypothetical protein JOZ55_06220, partial [Alphaproteobacteria bacterium]|nr:hypothetical protein [Alphaproteobacteria bacterium]